MQKLVFEPAWDKTIAKADRETIINLFNETKTKVNEGIVFHSIKQAKNHRNDLLAIVLVHNFTNEIFSFESIDATYFEKSKKIATEHFSFPGLNLKPKTSMPWTFIFPESAHLHIPTLRNGYITIKYD